MQTAFVARTSEGQSHHNSLGFIATVWIAVHPLLTDSVPWDAQARIESSDGRTEEHRLNSGRDQGDGLLHFPVVNPRSGITYTVSLKAGDQEEYITVIRDYELHPYVAQVLDASVVVEPPKPVDTGEVWIEDEQDEEKDVEADGPSPYVGPLPVVRLS